MPFLDPIRFEGSLSGNGHSVPVGFSASIDDLGKLQLQLDRLPSSAEARGLRRRQRLGDEIDHISLAGQAMDGRKFSSDSFFISSFNHGSEAGRELSIQGTCDDAEIVLTNSHDNGSSARVWHVRQLRTFRRLACDIALGRVVVGGPEATPGAQEPYAFLSIVHGSGEGGDEWWAATERLLTHVARVMSFGSDIYLRPVLEKRYRHGELIVRVVHQPRTPPPFMAPFHHLNMAPIFRCACETFPSRYHDIELLDPAIRWLTAPVAYDESRLINAMSALESIIHRAQLPFAGHFFSTEDWRRLRKDIRGRLQDLDLPKGVLDKLPELNRRSFSERIRMLLAQRKIVTNDLPKDWLKLVIDARNEIIHTGTATETDEAEPDTLDFTIWTREIVMRIILERLGFKDSYRSCLHGGEQLSFPGCRLMSELVAEGLA